MARPIDRSHPPGPPLIAITAGTREDGGTRRVRLNVAYVASLERAGALPLIVPPLSSIAEAGRLLDAVQGLLLTGGEDVDPARFGAPPHEKLGEVDPARDATELALVSAARDRRLPTLAICRGMQLLNVAFGGSLIQDIPAERPDALDHDPKGPRAARVHDVEIEPTSRLALVLGVERLRVNSFHHQAVDRAAEGLRATAWAPDGIIEGVEWSGDDGGDRGDRGDWWAVGVQWHPEEMDGESVRLFQALVGATRRA
jgi:putative glutamine amidotransferase